jgi:uncharacterized membrane protein
LNRFYSLKPLTLPGLWLGLVIFLYVAVLTWLHALRLSHFMNGFDLAFYQQAIWNTTQGRFLEVSATDFSSSLLGTDVVLIYTLMAPFYLLLPSPLTLLVLETIVVGLGAVPIYLLARDKLKNAWAGLGLALVYLLLPVVQNGNLYELRERQMAAACLLFAFYFWYKQRLGWFSLFAVLALCCRPENGLVLVMLGLYGWLSGKPWLTGKRPKPVQPEQLTGEPATKEKPNYWRIWLPVVLGLAWFGAALLVIRAASVGGNFALGSTFAGGSPISAVTTIFTNPVEGFRQLFPTGQVLLGKLLYIPLLLLPLAFLPLLRPLPLLMALPPVGLNLLAGERREIQWNPFDYHYQASVIPWLMVATIFALAALTERPPRFLRRLGPKPVVVLSAGLIGLVLVVNIWVNLVRIEVPGVPPVKNGWAAILSRKDDARWAGGKELLKQVPADAPLAISNTWAPYVPPRQGLWLFARRALYSMHPEQSAKFIFADVRNPASEEAQLAAEILATGQWRKQAEASGYVLLARIEGRT